MRLISLDIFKHVKDYITSKKITLTNIDFHIHKIKATYLIKFKNDDYTFGIGKDRFLNIVNDIFQIYYDEIKDTIVKEDNDLNLLSLKLRNLFKIYNKTIANCISSFDKFSLENDPKLINQLINIGLHDSDAILVDDCYNKSKEINEKFVFMTNDNDIINCCNDAAKILNSQIHFSKPISFLSN